jgi:hypothetical protein
MTIFANTCASEADRKFFIFPASFGQRRLWFNHQKHPDQAVYHISGAARAVGFFDLEAFRRSIREIAHRHEALRTRFVTVEGEPHQVIEMEIDVEVPVIDLGSMSWEEREQAVRRLVGEEINAPFDLQSVPLWRVKLFRVDDQDHVLLIVMHHIISDGWSMGVMLGEVSLLYSAFISGSPSPLPELSVQYADFSEWERALLRGTTLEKHLAYWKTQLAGTKALNLPYDRPKQSPPPGKGASYSLHLDRGLAEELRSLSQRENVTLYMTLLAAYQTLLYRYTGQRDIAVGCNIARRTQPEVEGVIGYFANNLILRTKLSGMWTFHQLLAHVKETALAAYAHQDIPLDRIVQELELERDPTRPLLFHVTFTLQNLPHSELRLGTMVLWPFETDIAPAKHDISVFITDTGDSMLFGVLYNKDLFDPDTITGLFKHYAILLQSIVDHPERPVSELSL